MQEYIGTKLIKAEPMTRGEYAKLSGRNSIMTEKVNPRLMKDIVFVMRTAMNHGLQRQYLKRLIKSLEK